jgi:hypothetical protein
MTIQAINQGLWIPNSCPFTVALPAYITQSTMAAAASRTAYIFQVPKTGTLDWFEVRQNVNSNTPDNGLRFAFMDLDAAGKPDNTEDQYSIVTAGFAAGAWLVPPSYMGAGGPGSGAKRAVTKGDWIACQVRMENFVAGDSVAMSTLDYGVRPATNFNLNCYNGSSGNSGATWSTSQVGGICVALKYDDGTYGQMEWPNMCPTAFNLRTFNSGSTPDERGLLFQIPFPGRLTGVWVRIDSDNAFDIVLYDAASSAVFTETPSFVNVYATSGANAYYKIGTPPTLTKNVNYRLAIKPGASNISIYDMDFNSSAIRIANVPHSTWMSTSRTNAGAWTDTNTNVPFIGLVFDGFDDATGGGGGEHSAVF